MKEHVSMIYSEDKMQDIIREREQIKTEEERKEYENEDNILYESHNSSPPVSLIREYCMMRGELSDVQSQGESSDANMSAKQQNWNNNRSAATMMIYTQDGKKKKIA